MRLLKQDASLSVYSVYPLILLLAAVCMTASCSIEPKTVLQSKHIQADDPHIRYIGFFTESYQFQWSASQIEYQFSGRSIAANFIVPEGKQVKFRIQVNDQESTLTVDANEPSYTLAHGLDDNTIHKLSIFRLSEAEFGPVQFNGFSVSDNARSYEIESTKRKLMVIGDSISCGYANEASSVDEGNSINNQNAYLSYGAITSRMADFDILLNCWSGRGLYRNRWLDNDTTGVMPELWGRALPGAEPEGDRLSTYIPDVIVVNLGTNDMNVTSDVDGSIVKTELAKEDYILAYHSLISQLKEFAPEAKLILAIGPMGYQPVSFWLAEIAEQYSHVYSHTFSPYSGGSEIGGHYHPNVLKHRFMAEELTETLMSIAGSN